MLVEKVFHGSNKVVETPVFGQGKIYNDYGQGFYLTEDIEMAKEWACPSTDDGIVNCYSLDLQNLSVLNLSDKNYNVLNWLAILVKNRSFSLKSDLSKSAFDYITSKFSIPYHEYDVIKGYRADDSYFSFANGFLNNNISLRQLDRAIRLGNLGEQIVLMSERAFKQIEFITMEVVKGEEYFPKRNERDKKVREDYKTLSQKMDLNDIYIVDILRQKWGNSDVRI